MTATLYTPDNLAELRAYTLRLLNMLERSGCLKEDVYEEWRSKFVDKDGNVCEGECGTQTKTLEYMIWNGQKYYYCDEDSSLYTYESHPVKIGYFDAESMTLISC